MEKEKLYDIGEVCKLLGTTSRTLRFYEEKGIISSTSVPFQSRRQYTKEQIDHIRNVLVLRTLGISVKAIKALQDNKIDLRDAVLSKRAEIAAAMDAKRKELVLLNEALTVIESGDDIFQQNPQDCVALKSSARISVPVWHWSLPPSVPKLLLKVTPTFCINI